MSYTNPYRMHNYMGEFANDAACLTEIQTKKWDSNGDSTGVPLAGMWYFNTTNDAPYYYDGSSWLAFGADPMTTRGDVIIRNASNETARLGIGTANQVLQSDGTDITWQSPEINDLSDGSTAGTGNVFLATGSTASGTYNTCLGYGAGATISSSELGDNNVVIGKEAVNGGTVTATFDSNVAIGIDSFGGAGAKSGNDNIGIGQQSLFDLTSGTYNVGIGYYSLTSITSGSHSVGVGTNSLFSVTTGARNIAVGYNAGYQITEGNDNIAIGYGAVEGGSATSAFSNNIAIGLDAMGGAGAKSGNGNIAIGQNVMTALTSATYGIGIGYGCLLNITTGNFNLCAGYNSGNAITTGTGNCLFGYRSGVLLVGGSSNIAMGTNSLCAAQTTSSSNVIIGAYTGNAMSGICSKNTMLGAGAGGSSATGTKTDNVYIGYNAGNHADYIDTDNELIIANSATNTPMIYGTFPNTLFKITATSIQASGQLIIDDNATTAPLRITERSTAPSSPVANDIYLDDGSNTDSGNPRFRRYTGAVWEDIGD